MNHPLQPLVEKTPEQGDAGERCSVALGSAVLLAAKKLRKIKRRAAVADADLQALMRDRYGDHDEMPDSLVEIIEYSNGPDSALTLAYIDAEMTAAGFPPNNCGLPPEGRRAP
jgi:hypothetical protein